jgi:hypothetical protein
MIIAKHTAELCPGGMIKPDKEFTAKLEKDMKESKVKVVGGYLDAPGHTWYFIIEADSSTALNNAVEQLRLTGEVVIVPVLEFLAGIVWAKKIGIQK